MTKFLTVLLISLMYLSFSDHPAQGKDIAVHPCSDGSGWVQDRAIPNAFAVYTTDSGKTDIYKSMAWQRRPTKFTDASELDIFQMKMESDRYQVVVFGYGEDLVFDVMDALQMKSSVSGFSIIPGYAPKGEDQGPIVGKEEGDHLREVWVSKSGTIVEIKTALRGSASQRKKSEDRHHQQVERTLKRVGIDKEATLRLKIDKKK